MPPLPKQQPLVTLPVAPYAPDMPALQGSASVYVNNVLPRTPESYGPMPTFAASGGALGAQCRGMFSAEDSSGNFTIFAGTATDLYSYTSSSTTPSNISKSAAAYSTPTDGQWKFLQFGNYVLATNFNDPIQVFTLGTSTTFSDLAYGDITALTLVAGSGYTNGTYALSVTNPGSGTGFAGTVTVSGGALSSTSITNNGSGYPQTATIAIPAGAGAGSGGSITPTIQTIAPKARYIAAIKSFVVAVNTDDPTNGSNPQRVWACSNNDPTTWPTPGTATAAQDQSDFWDVVGDGGWNQAVVGNLGNADGALVQERMIWRIVYNGTSSPLSFYPMEGAKGTPAPNSVVHFSDQFFYLGEDGWYRNDGAASYPIGANRVDKSFWNDVNLSYLFNVIGAVDPENHCIVWIYPSGASSTGVPDTVLVYNWQLDRWAPGDANLEWIGRGFTFGYNLDNIDGFGNLDTLPFSLDSRFWAGGQELLGGFDTNHKLAFYNGSSAAATVDTTETQAVAGNRALVTEAWPIVDGDTPSVAIGTRNRQEDTISFGTASAMNATGFCPVRAEGRYHRARVTMAAGANWKHIEGVQLKIEPGSRR